jgi:hypothetical protein
LIIRALRDGYDVSFLSGQASMTKRAGRSALDACARALPEPSPLLDIAAKGTRLAPDTSFVFLVTGPHPDYVSLLRASSQFDVEVGKLVLRVDSTAEPSLRSRGDLPVITIGRLDQLGIVLKWGLS